MHHTTNGSRPKQKRSTRRDLNRNIFADVNAAATGRIEDLVLGWVSKSHISGDNLFALNPTRDDRKPNSFCINLRTGVWADFATGDSGGDIISYYAYIFRLSQIEAARELADQLGVSK
jgi:DNA primase